MTFGDSDADRFQSGTQGQARTDLISLDAIILLACVQCEGSDTDKAEVFLRVVSPEMLDHIVSIDKDLRTAVHFMITISTIFEEMTREISRNPSMGMNF